MASLVDVRDEATCSQEALNSVIQAKSVMTKGNTKPNAKPNERCGLRLLR